MQLGLSLTQFSLFCHVLLLLKVLVLLEIDELLLLGDLSLDQLLIVCIDRDQNLRTILKGCLMTDNLRLNYLLDLVVKSYLGDWLGLISNFHLSLWLLNSNNLMDLSLVQIDSILV